MEKKIDKFSGDLAIIRTKVDLVVTSISLVQQEQVQVTKMLKSGVVGSATPAADNVMGAVPSGWASNTSADREPVHEQEELTLGPHGLLTAHNLDLGPFLLKQACGIFILGEVNTDVRTLEFAEQAARALEHRGKGAELQLTMSLHIAAAARCYERGRHGDAIPVFDNLRFHAQPGPQQPHPRHHHRRHRPPRPPPRPGPAPLDPLP
jgi:hypothetical protein